MKAISARTLVDLMPIVADRHWSVVRVTNGDQAIRDPRGCCPLVALVQEIDRHACPEETIAYWTALSKIDVTGATTGPRLVARAADRSAPGGTVPGDLRREMLAILGTQEPA